MHELLAKLSAPFPPEAVSWRVGSTTGDKTRGKPLAYIDARDVMDRLDEVCGLGWECRYSHAADKVCCEIIIHTEDGFVTRSDGAGDTDFEGDKGAFSDAFKRAAVRFGVGRYLYGIKAPWVEIEQAGKSHHIKQSELPRLQRLLEKASGVEPSIAGPSLADTLRRSVELEAHKLNNDAIRSVVTEYGNIDLDVSFLERKVDEYAKAKDRPGLDKWVASLSDAAQEAVSRILRDRRTKNKQPEKKAEV